MKKFKATDLNRELYCLQKELETTVERIELLKMRVERMQKMVVETKKKLGLKW